MLSEVEKKHSIDVMAGGRKDLPVLQHKTGHWGPRSAFSVCTSPDLNFFTQHRLRAFPIYTRAEWVQPVLL